MKLDFADILLIIAAITYMIALLYVGVSLSEGSFTPSKWRESGQNKFKRSTVLIVISFIIGYIIAELFVR